MAGDPASCVAKDAASANIQGDALTSGIVVDIRGRIGAGVLDVDVTSAACAHHWHLEKRH
jgi:hypothetical protein